MSRREIREKIFKLLFRTEFYEEGDLAEQSQLFFEELGQEENQDTAYTCDVLQTKLRKAPQFRLSK